MNDSTELIAGHSKRYNIPLSHFEHKYIQSCTDGKELERIYKELKGGEMGSFPELEKLTLERIAKIKPNSQILRQDKPPADRSALPMDEEEDLHNFLKKMGSNSQNQQNTTDVEAKETISAPIRSKTTAAVKVTSNSSVPTPATVINKNNKTKRVVPRSYAEWGKLEKSLGDKSESDEDERKDDKKKNVQVPSTAKSVNDAKERAEKADEHRLSGNTAFRSNNYQQSIDSYTKSIQYDDNNSVVYMNRALAHFRLKNYDASLADCSLVLNRDPNHVKALFRRASCRLAKEHYSEARTDLERLLELEPTNLEAKNLLKTIPDVQKPKSVRIAITEDDGEDEQMNVPPPPPPPSQPIVSSGPVKIPIMEVDEEEEEEEVETEVITHQASSTSMNINIPSKPAAHNRPGIDSQDASPAMFDQYLHQTSMHYPIASNDTGMNHEHGMNRSDDDDDDDLPLGGEAMGDMIDNMSDDEGPTSRNFNVSPTGDVDEDDGDEPPELINTNHLSHESSLSIRSQHRQNENIHRSVAFHIDNTFNQREVSKISPDRSDIYDDEMSEPTPATSDNRKTIHSVHKSLINCSSSIVSAEYSSTSSHNDLIANSNFCPTIQNWLHENVEYQSSRRTLSANEKPWSKDRRPDTLNKLQLDIERFNRLSDFNNAIEASKKMLTNGCLDYHLHAEYIVNALVLCAQCNSKLKKYILAIQYASEALQYNKTDTNALLCRARAFENEDCLIYSYSDYARIPSSDQSYSIAQKACEALALRLNETKGDTWREELPDYTDDELYLKFIRMKDESKGDNFDWYRIRGNQLYMDGCYILAIRCYTICNELKSTATVPLLNRAACYFKVFEPRKAIEDCDRVLELEPTNVRALYRKACAYKLAKEHQFYSSTLQNLLKLQPNNQILLSEYYSFRNEQMPRQKRRLRMNPTTAATTAKVSSTSVVEPIVPIEIKPIETPYISYEELETIRKKTRKMSPNTGYQFTNTLNTLKEPDIAGQCQLILSVPTKLLYNFAHNASPKIVEMILRVCLAMIEAEKGFIERNPSTSLPYSYTEHCFQLLVQLTTLPRLDSALGMIGEDYRLTLNEIFNYYSSISSLTNEIDKLKRLRQ